MTASGIPPSDLDATLETKIADTEWLRDFSETLLKKVPQETEADTQQIECLERHVKKLERQIKTHKRTLELYLLTKKN